MAIENMKWKVKGILFDLDGTIVDSKEAYLEAVKTAFAETGQHVIEESTMLEIPKRLEQSLPIDTLLNGIDAKEFRKTYIDAFYNATATKTRPIPNVYETLEKLSEKTKLALTTMRYIPKEKVISELDKLSLAKHFQYVITALDTRSPKPSPEALIKCASQLNVKTYECIVVGDSPMDIKAGKTAGAKTVAVLSGIFSRKELERENPDLIIENVNKLPDFLE